MVETSAGVNPAEYGRHLSLVRERAGVKQSELAKATGMSSAVLSRIESGDRPATVDEVILILKNIGTPEAEALITGMGRTWQVLPTPPLDHADQDLLWTAECAAVELDELRERPDTPHAFERRLSEYLEEIRRTAGCLLKRDHQIAFIGSVGVGKSTAICRVTDLVVERDDGSIHPVLEVGGGGTTICEVHLRTGPGYGIIIDPCSEDEIRQDVADLADSVIRESNSAEDDPSDLQGISKEVWRSLRNMAGLAIQRVRDANGKRSSFDPAKLLAQEYPNTRDFIVEVLSRMALPRRDRRDIWYDTSTGKSPKLWLRDMFSAINNGRHPEVSLPKRIEVVVPERLLSDEALTVRFIDTKGIDRTAAREDIENHLSDPHTLAVLCSQFNNAPAAEARLLLERAKEGGFRDLENNVSILVFPRPGEAKAMKDDATGDFVESDEEGYELKQEQVALALEPLGLGNLAVGFYNANEDKAERAQAFFIEQLRTAREAFRHSLKLAVQGSQALLVNHGEERVRAVLQDAGELMLGWVNLNSDVKFPNAKIQESLLANIELVYASTVRAAVRREGEWAQLSYFHHIGYGARRLAVMALDASVSSFESQCKVMASTPRYAEAQHLIAQAERVLRSSYDELLRKVNLMAQATYKDALRADGNFWQDCMQEWGQGPGYKTRIIRLNEAWFNSEVARGLETDIIQLIVREWSKALKNVASLFEAT